MDDKARQQIYRWILDGSTEQDLKDAIREKFPKEDGEKAIIETLKEFGKALDNQKEIMVGWCVEATKDLYRKSVEVGDFSNALKAVKQLEGLAKKMKSSENEFNI